MSRTVLLIDDDHLPTEYYYYALKECGFEVIHCDDADGAQQMWRDLRPDLIVLDVMMHPGTLVRAEDTKEGLHSGLLLYQWLRQDLPGTPVIVLTHLLSAATLFNEFKEDRLLVLQKARVPPLELATISRRMLKNFEAVTRG